MSGKEELLCEFEAAFSKADNFEIWETVGAVPLTCKCLSNTYAMKTVYPNVTVFETISEVAT